jgi:hypothetical protein
MNSYLKKYTDALLTLHGIPLTNYEHDVGVEDLLAEMTARKTLETAMWNLCQHAEAQAAAIKQYEMTGRKPDELWTDEETRAFRVKIAAHNEEAKRRHAERQKTAATQ